MNFSHSSAPKTHRIDINFLKTVLTTIPSHAVKRLFKPLLLLVLLLTCVGIYLLLYRASSSPPLKSIPFPHDFESSKYHQKLKKILKPPANGENSIKDAAHNNNEAADVKKPISINNHDERNKMDKALPSKHVDKTKIKKHKRIGDEKKSQQIEQVKWVNISIDFVPPSSMPKNYPNYYEDGLHPDWVFKISRTYDDNHLHHWTEANRTVPKSEPWTQGENGTRFVPKNEAEKSEMQKLLDKHNYNIYGSEQISLHRSLPDYRYPECRNLTYPDRLPTVSVVIVMHNEAWSTTLRTVWSIIDRSPTELLHEIIIIDDVSTWDFLKRPLSDYIAVLPARIRIIRTTKREGLIRARLIGAKHATGDILVFFDAHMECTKGWLEPIAARIANDRSVVAVPLIDAIGSYDMGYGAAYKTNIAGLRWHLIFNWINISNKELLRTKGDRTAPIRAPTHVGCAFAVDREFFFEIGSYDTGMDIWGAENVELAFRVWLCGGSLEVVQCSRVGHLFRISTYSFNGDQNEITARNTNRLVEVWMDEFKEFFYASNPRARNISPGDLTARKQLRKQLKCKNFRWYLENVYPEFSWLRKYNLMGEFKSVSKQMCLDIDSTAINKKLRLWPCHGSGGNQFFAFEESGLIVTVEEICVGVNEKKEVILVYCTDGDQTKLWTYDEKRKWIINKDSGLCMRNENRDVILGDCKLNDERSQWTFQSTAAEKKN